MKRLTILLAAVGALMLVPAASAFAFGNLNVTIEGSGSGNVEGTPGGGFPMSFTCSYVSPGPATGTCSLPLVENEEETLEGLSLESLEAAPGSETSSVEIEGASFDFGCVPNGSCNAFNPIGTETDIDLTVVYTKLPTQPLTTKINEGEGTLVSDPAGIECTGAAPTTCEEEFEEGAEVTLTASPAAGYRFYNWPSCPGTVTGRQCKVTMSAAKEVKVNFKKTWTLTLSKASGSEAGILKALPTGVACPLYCTSSTYTFLDGQEVTIDRYEPIGYLHFTEFTGGTGSAEACNGESTPCAITLEEDSVIEGLFEENAKATLSLQKQGGGQAKITSTGNKIYCFNSCDSSSGTYYTEPSPEEATVSWTFGAGTTSIEWTTGAGTCTGKSTSNGSCKVTMDEAHELVAKLE